MPRWWLGLLVVLAGCAGFGAAPNTVEVGACVHSVAFPGQPKPFEGAAAEPGVDRVALVHRRKNSSLIAECVCTPGISPAAITRLQAQIAVQTMAERQSLILTQHRFSETPEGEKSSDYAGVLPNGSSAQFIRGRILWEDSCELHLVAVTRSLAGAEIDSFLASAVRDDEGPMTAHVAEEPPGPPLPPTVPDRKRPRR